MDALLVVAGAGTGFLIGLTGVGGGALMTPLLLLLFGTVPSKAVGTDLYFAAVTKLAATQVYHQYGVIDWQVAKRLWLGSLPASALALLWMRGQTFNADYAEFLTLLIASMVILTAIGLLLQNPLHILGRRYCITWEGEFKAIQCPLTILVGALLGVLVTLTSVGAGALGAVMLIYLYPLRLTPSRLVATDIVHAIPLTLFAGLGHLLIGDLDFSLLGNLLVGSIPGILIASRLSIRLPHVLMKRILAVVLFSIGLKLWQH